MFYLLDLFGTAVFAMTGILAAREKQLDWYGGLVLAVVTAIGGGTFRDAVIGRTPVFWIQDDTYLWVALVAGLATTPFIKRIQTNRLLNWSDAFGLGLFTVIGCKVAIDHQLSATIAVLMGVATGTFGGMIRDLLCNRIPLVLREEIYATAAIIGALIYWLASQVFHQELIGTVLCIATVSTLRILAIEKHWHLPRFNSKD